MVICSAESLKNEVKMLEMGSYDDLNYLHGNWYK